MARAISKSVRQAAAQELVSAVKNFNSRIRNAVKSGRLPAEFAPDRASARDILASVKDLPSAEQYYEIKRRTRQLEKARGKLIEPKETKAGAQTTQWEIDVFKQNQRRVNEQRRKAAQRTGEMIAGQRVDGQKAAWSKAAAMKPFSYKPSREKEFRKLSRFMQKMAQPSAQKYYDNFKKAMRNRYSGADLTKIMKALEKAGAAGLDRAYHSGQAEADLNTYPDAHYARGKGKAAPGAPALDLPSADAIVRVLKNYT